jgi:hypothetical protein
MLSELIFSVLQEGRQGLKMLDSEQAPAEKP